MSRFSNTGFAHLVLVIVAVAVSAALVIFYAQSYIERQFWPDAPAPWEAVDAYYYPDRNNLAFDSRKLGVADLAECRAWVKRQAAAYGDPELARGDYECGVGRTGARGDVMTYRLTVR